MTRRTLAAATAVLAVFMLAPDRAGSEPATTSTTNVLGLPADSGSPPLSLYPRRPGAKYEESEAASTGTMVLGLSAVRILHIGLVPKSALPNDLVPGDPSRYEQADLLDGYVPSRTQTGGDLLHIVVRVNPAPTRDPLMCTATLASDGTVLVPYGAPAVRSRRSGPSTSTTEAALYDKPVDVDLYFPIGAPRGRVFLTCDSSLFGSLDGTGLFGASTRPVWGLDV